MPRAPFPINRSNAEQAKKDAEKMFGRKASPDSNLSLKDFLKKKFKRKSK